MRPFHKNFTLRAFDRFFFYLKSNLWNCLDIFQVLLLVDTKLLLFFFKYKNKYFQLFVKLNKDIYNSVRNNFKKKVFSLYIKL